MTVSIFAINLFAIYVPNKFSKKLVFGEATILMSNALYH